MIYFQNTTDKQQTNLWINDGFDKNELLLKKLVTEFITKSYFKKVKKYITMILQKTPLVLIIWFTEMLGISGYKLKRNPDFG